MKEKEPLHGSHKVPFPKREFAGSYVLRGAGEDLFPERIENSGSGFFKQFFRNPVTMIAVWEGLSFEGDHRIMASIQNHTDGLMERARDGDPIAEGAIFSGQRDRLRGMIAARIDRRIAARIDPSDVIQEALAEASLRLSAYLRNPPLPLLPWLYQFALERLAKLHRYHILAGKRSVGREQTAPELTSAGEDMGAGHRFISRGTSPSSHLIRDETRERVRIALAGLPEGDRKILAMRHIEALSMTEIATLLGISEGAAKVRHMRALRRLQPLLEDPR